MPALESNRQTRRDSGLPEMLGADQWRAITLERLGGSEDLTAAAAALIVGPPVPFIDSAKWLLKFWPSEAVEKGLDATCREGGKCEINTIGKRDDPTSKGTPQGPRARGWGFTATSQLPTRNHAALMEATYLGWPGWQAACLTELHPALDFPTKSMEDAIALQWPFIRSLVRKWRRAGLRPRAARDDAPFSDGRWFDRWQMQHIEGLTYSDDYTSRRLFKVYPTVCKVTGEPCLHFEVRLIGSDAIRVAFPWACWPTQNQPEPPMPSWVRLFDEPARPWWSDVLTFKRVSLSFEELVREAYPDEPQRRLRHRILRAAGGGFDPMILAGSAQWVRDNRRLLKRGKHEMSALLEDLPNDPFLPPSGTIGGRDS